MKRVKESLLYSSYAKAQKEMNVFLEIPNYILDEDDFYPEFEYYIDEEDYIPPSTFESKILQALCESVSKETPDDKFLTLIKDVELNMVSVGMDIHIAGLFYFRSLWENLHYFTYDEQLKWMTKIEEMFSPFNQFACKAYTHFYELYFKTQFFGGENSYYTHFYKQMQYTYVFLYSYFESEGELTPEFIKKFIEFSYRYVEFYKELTLELENKRQVKINDQIICA